MATAALLAIAVAAVWFAVSWRQHNPPCPTVADVSQAQTTKNFDGVPINCLNFPLGPQ